MSKEIVLGTSAQANASVRNGWVIGPFMPENSLAHMQGVEVKHWHYDDQPDYPPKTFNGKEYIAIFGGELKMDVVIDGVSTEVRLVGSKHQYVILPPHSKQVFVVQAPAFGITVRWKDPLMHAGEYTP